MGILTVLMTAGVSMLGGSGARSRKAAADLLTGMVEQARTTAISSRCYVLLAVAEPGDLSGRDQVCRVGLFKLGSRPDGLANPVTGVMVGRWRTLEPGVILTSGRVEGLDNPLDGPEVTVSYGNNKPHLVKVHALVFNSRGGLQYPSGSAPVVIRMAEGHYRGGKATPFVRGESRTIAETRLRIGRVTARPYRIDG